MRSEKIAIGIVCVFAILAMTGLATAGDESIEVKGPGGVINPTIPYDPNFITYTVNITQIENQTAVHTIKAEDLVPDSNLEFRFHYLDGGTSSTWLDADQTWNWGPPNRATANLTMDVRAKSSARQNQYYTWNVTDTGGTVDSATEHAHGSTSGTTIPEFATIAIPITITLGIMFLLFRRKQKE